jgi:hypothetical protein
VTLYGIPSHWTPADMAYQVLSAASLPPDYPGTWGAVMRYLVGHLELPKRLELELHESHEREAIASIELARLTKLLHEGQSREGEAAAVGAIALTSDDALAHVAGLERQLIDARSLVVKQAGKIDSLQATIDELTTEAEEADTGMVAEALDSTGRDAREYVESLEQELRNSRATIDELAIEIENLAAATDLDLPPALFAPKEVQAELAELAQVVSDHPLTVRCLESEHGNVLVSARVALYVLAGELEKRDRDLARLGDTEALHLESQQAMGDDLAQHERERLALADLLAVLPEGTFEPDMNPLLAAGRFIARAIEANKVERETSGFGAEREPDLHSEDSAPPTAVPGDMAPEPDPIGKLMETSPLAW